MVSYTDHNLPDNVGSGGTSGKSNAKMSIAKDRPICLTIYLLNGECLCVGPLKPDASVFDVMKEIRAFLQIPCRLQTLLYNDVPIVEFSTCNSDVNCTSICDSNRGMNSFSSVVGSGNNGGAVGLHYLEHSKRKLSEVLWSGSFRNSSGSGYGKTNVASGNSSHLPQPDDYEQLDMRDYYVQNYYSSRTSVAKEWLEESNNVNDPNNKNIADDPNKRNSGNVENDPSPKEWGHAGDAYPRSPSTTNRVRTFKPPANAVYAELSLITKEYTAVEVKELYVELLEAILSNGADKHTKVKEALAEGAPTHYADLQKAQRMIIMNAMGDTSVAGNQSSDNDRSKADTIDPTTQLTNPDTEFAGFYLHDLIPILKVNEYLGKMEASHSSMPHSSRGTWNSGSDNSGSDHDGNNDHGNDHGNNNDNSGSNNNGNNNSGSNPTIPNDTHPILPTIHPFPVPEGDRIAWMLAYQMKYMPPECSSIGLKLARVMGIGFEPRAPMSLGLSFRRQDAVVAANCVYGPAFPTLMSSSAVSLGEYSTTMTSIDSNYALNLVSLPRNPYALERGIYLDGTSGYYVDNDNQSYNTALQTESGSSAFDTPRGSSAEDGINIDSNAEDGENSDEEFGYHDLQVPDTLESEAKRFRHMARPMVGDSFVKKGKCHIDSLNQMEKTTSADVDGAEEDATKDGNDRDGDNDGDGNKDDAGGGEIEDGDEQNANSTQQPKKKSRNKKKRAEAKKQNERNKQEEEKKKPENQRKDKERTDNKEKEIKEQAWNPNLINTDYFAARTVRALQEEGNHRSNVSRLSKLPLAGLTPLQLAMGIDDITTVDILVNQLNVEPERDLLNWNQWEHVSCRWKLEMPTAANRTLAYNPNYAKMSWVNSKFVAKAVEEFNTIDDTVVDDTLVDDDAVANIADALPTRKGMAEAVASTPGDAEHGRVSSSIVDTIASGVVASSIASSPIVAPKTPRSALDFLFSHCVITNNPLAASPLRGNNHCHPVGNNALGGSNNSLGKNPCSTFRNLCREDQLFSFATTLILKEVSRKLLLDMENDALKNTIHLISVDEVRAAWGVKGFVQLMRFYGGRNIAFIDFHLQGPEAERHRRKNYYEVDDENSTSNQHKNTENKESDLQRASSSVDSQNGDSPGNSPETAPETPEVLAERRNDTLKRLYIPPSTHLTTWKNITVSAGAFLDGLDTTYWNQNEVQKTDTDSKNAVETIDGRRETEKTQGKTEDAVRSSEEFNFLPSPYLREVISRSLDIEPSITRKATDISEHLNDDGTFTTRESTKTKLTGEYLDRQTKIEKNSDKLFTVTVVPMVNLVNIKLHRGEGVEASSLGNGLHACAALSVTHCDAAYLLAKMLLDMRCDVDGRDSEGDSPLAHARFFSSEKLYNLYRNQGARLLGNYFRG